MTVSSNIRPRIILVASVIVVKIVLGNTLHWDALQSETVPSHEVYTEATLRDVGFRDVSFTLAMLSWTVDGIVQTKLVSVELFVKRLSDTKDVDWQPLSHLSFNHPVGSKSAQALRFGRDLNVIHGEAYRANVTLISGIKNMTSTVDVTTVPFGPKTVNLNELEVNGTKALGTTFDNTRIDAYFGQFEKPDKTLAGTFGPYPLDRPVLTESEVWISTSLPFRLVPGQTYRLVLAFMSWERRSSTLTGSNYLTVAPSAPVIEHVQRFSNGSLRVRWMLSTGIADTFILKVSQSKRVINGDEHMTSLGRYSADIDGLKYESSYFVTVRAESDRTKGPESQPFMYSSEDELVQNDGNWGSNPSNCTKQPMGGVHRSNGIVIAPWVISGVLVVIVLILAIILGLTIRKLRQLRSTIRKRDSVEPQPEYESIRTSYLHPI